VQLLQRKLKEVVERYNRLTAQVGDFAGVGSDAVLHT
jgi:hypothetical protein